MISPKLFSLLFLALGAHCHAIDSRAASAAAVYPVNPVGNMAAVQIGVQSQQTRLFYQDQDDNIVLHVLENGAFTTGQTIGSRVLVPGTDVLRYTPIAASVIGDGSKGIHVYFLSASRTLREYRYDQAGGWRGGDGCPGCIDHAGFAVSDDTLLYALQNPTSNMLRVGFVSPGAPGTVSEAVTSNNGATWQLAGLPDT